MANPNLVRKVSDSPSGGAGEVSSSSILSTSRFTRNYIINGDMRFSQRATSFVAAANGYCLDRYVYEKNGTMVHTISQDTDVPTMAQAGVLFQNSLRLNLTTSDTSIAAGEWCQIVQKIEGCNFVNIAQKNFTLSFWVKATLPGIYCVAFKSSTLDRSYVAEYTITAASTWEHKIITVTGSPSGGTWNYTNGIGLIVTFGVAIGSTYHTTVDSWQTGNFAATANIVNGVNTGSTDFRITGVMLNEGSQAAPFRTFGNSINEEINACQRYYEKSYALVSAPGTNGFSGAQSSSSTNSGGGGNLLGFRFPVIKRATPTITIYHPITGTINSVYEITTAAAKAVLGANQVGEHGVLEIVATGGVLIDDDAYYYHWTADAEL